jgi:hypothetical protein
MTDTEARIEAETYIACLSASLLLTGDAVWQHIEPGVLNDAETAELRNLCGSINAIGVRLMEIGRGLRSAECEREGEPR